MFSACLMFITACSLELYSIALYVFEIDLFKKSRPKHQLPVQIGNSVIFVKRTRGFCKLLFQRYRSISLSANE